ncbi:hypothetical protein BDW75DRAFT_205821 [Aspergillus navahoensis]
MAFAILRCVFDSRDKRRRIKEDPKDLTMSQLRSSRAIYRLRPCCTTLSRPSTEAHPIPPSCVPAPLASQLICYVILWLAPSRLQSHE